MISKQQLLIFDSKTGGQRFIDTVAGLDWKEKIITLSSSMVSVAYYSVLLQKSDLIIG